MFCTLIYNLGYGGGYNDRGVVEYKERRDSDDEYDEFGRRKRKSDEKKRREDSSSNSRSDSSRRYTSNILDWRWHFLSSKSIYIYSKRSKKDESDESESERTGDKGGKDRKANNEEADDDDDDEDDDDDDDALDKYKLFDDESEKEDDSAKKASPDKKKSSDSSARRSRRSRSRSRCVQRNSKQEIQMNQKSMTNFQLALSLFTDRVRILRAVAAAAVAVVIRQIVRGGAVVENHAAIAVVDLAIRDIQDILDHVRDLILVRMHDIVVDKMKSKEDENKGSVRHHSYLSTPFPPKETHGIVYIISVCL